MTRTRRGRFVTLEGVDGAGKSTHVRWLVDTLRERGLAALATREPGGTALGEQLRHLMLTEPMHLKTETLLMFAARCEHLHTVIMPALDRGQWVVCDRFTDATYAYQGGGRGLDHTAIANLERWVHPGLRPDLTLLFDIPLAVARERLAENREPDRFEREGPSFFERTRAAYLERAAADPTRIRIVDATRDIAAVRNDLARWLDALIRADSAFSTVPRDS